uniref:B30.2/SPRY domain-containing protein n=1 Tax=Sinocyclocheilus grahami TaxID=75366 RepID=A0A672LXH8_SINGR
MQQYAGTVCCLHYTSLHSYTHTLKKNLCIVKLSFIFCVFSVNVTLDPDTAHPDLILSDDGKQVRDGDIRQKLPDKPERFDTCPCVLGKEGFSSGRFYFEVQVKGKTEWDLGVARESINRKGEITLSPNEYEACEDPSVSLSLRVKPQRVGVFVDYEEGLVCFYDVESSSHIYSFTAQRVWSAFMMWSPALISTLSLLSLSLKNSIHFLAHPSSMDVKTPTH